VWQQDDGIYSRSYSDGTWGPPARISNVVPSGEVYAPQIVFDASGSALVVWNQKDDARSGIYTSHFDVWSNRYGAVAGWGAPERISDGVGTTGSANIALGQNSGAVAIWAETNDGDYYGASSKIWSSRHE
jgi:hypothetical protein